MKTILVSGDLIRDYSLVRSPEAASWLLEPVAHALLHESPGGAWYLRDLVALACADLAPQVLAPDPSVPGRRAYTIWAPQPAVRGQGSKVWRAEEFLGCEPPSPDAEPQPRTELAQGVDLLVLDDLALDFRNRPELWPGGLGDDPGPGAILLKQSQPLAEGALWRRLIERWADRLTVVVSVNALRARGARIAESRSWDLAVEQTVQEIEQGESALDFGSCRRVVVQFGGAGAASFVRQPDQDQVRFERFVYHPELFEDTWNARHPGRTSGLLSIVAAALARHTLDPGSYPLFLALGRGLRAVQESHLLGGGSTRFDPAEVRRAIAAVYHPPRDEPGRPASEPAGTFFSAFPHGLLADPILREQPAAASDLLRDAAGTGLEYSAAKATEVVLRGPGRALTPVPKARYGGYLTADRQEIERINELRALIVSYLRNDSDRRPFSVAVFGQPGSGKSFAIKQLAADLFPGQKDLEFNLTKFGSADQLNGAFHQVRDACLQGQVPLVFWDEFDCAGLRWLDEFLMPMQDAKFQQGSLVHHLGRAIFVFAGGTCTDFQSFDRSSDPEERVREEFRKVKGPDFVSRLRTHLNIRGPNPGEHDTGWLIRRALLLRNVLERNRPHLIDGGGVARISPSVIRGFLRVERYLHGARSLEQVVINSKPGARFEQASLEEAVLRQHVTSDFLSQVAQGELEGPVIEALAEACHEGWRRVRGEEGWSYGKPRDDARKLHPMMKPYAELDEADQEKSRITARLTNAKLQDLGYRIARFTPRDQRQPPEFRFSEEERTRLMEIEHDIWLRDRLLQGYEYAPVTDEHLRLHRDMVPFQDQLPEDRRLDEAIVDAIPATLLSRRYKLVRNQ